MITVNMLHANTEILNPIKVDRVIVDECGGAQEVFVMWIEDSFMPEIVMVLADSFNEAYEAFVCDSRNESHLEVDEDDLDEDELDASSLNENGVLVWTETIRGFESSWANVLEAGTK